MFSIQSDMPSHLMRCTCSFCAKRGILWAYHSPSDFEVLSPVIDQATYCWNTKLAAHRFCASCGCSTFSDTPAFAPDASWDKVTGRIGVNARLFDDFDAAQASVVVIDGKHLW